MRTLILSSLLLLTGCFSYAESDKELHYVAGALTQHYVTKQTSSPVTGCLAAIGLGIAKEAYDSRFGGVVDRYDALATAGGCNFSVEW
ncbi:hypothetical protein SAMN04488527_10543 [Aliiroseovarius crassostreae]|uniref:Lipoprotein n=1 Tax=Aliiroseovarius crassostreae TaxID=154981 RepID=A0A0P7JME5_9RHOB|nr:hypothetical protein [Aliiroseovarius crassostreae]KPN62222.1 hypothetical protein AKJ29_08150 [Aliiroseovarius crassostreae]SFU53141.1 hypothetical protein SAMN04488527_10543 [Aliiroseovarius crassostreae]